MIQHMLENLLPLDWEMCVVTDHEKIEKHVEDLGFQVVRVDDDVPSGSDRIYLAYERFFKNKGFDFIINVQGDEPLIKSDHLNSLLEFHTSTSFDITTCFNELSKEHGFENSNNVKLVMSEVNQECLYFSRSPIPFDRDSNIEQTWKKHLGIYSYTEAALCKFFKCPSSKLEKIEKLEQLKALENGMKIGAIKINDKLIGVDTPEDIKSVERYC